MINVSLRLAATDTIQPVSSQEPVRREGRGCPEEPWALEAKGLWKSYFQGRRPSRRRRLLRRVLDWMVRLRDGQEGIEIPVLLGVDLQVRRGDFVSIVGPSGCGKSTLLHLLGTLDQPDQGEIWFEGRRIDRLAPRHRDRLRNKAFAFVFQFYHLLPELTVLENTLLPLLIRHGWAAYWRYGRAWRQKARQLLEQVGLGHRLRHKPAELSGGEMQRAAIARALIGDPKVLLADEPTGNLDPVTGWEVLQLLASLNREQGLTIIMATHDRELAGMATRCLRLQDGRLTPVSPEELRLR
jgi:lipoprotein-releasing system ATP-binding protein